MAEPLLALRDVRAGYGTRTRSRGLRERDPGAFAVVHDVERLATGLRRQLPERGTTFSAIADLTHSSSYYCRVGPVRTPRSRAR